ncbi:MAG: carboxymuconolactone decarboxylase family protein [Aureliella sp.]
MTITKKLFTWTLGLALAGAPLATFAQDGKSTPKPVPQTRAEMLAALDALKSRTPRLPLPPVTPEEIAAAEAAQASRAAASGTTPTTSSPGIGSLGLVNNGRMRNRYLPEDLRSGGFSRQADPAMKFDYTFSVELFWIVSRVNNCHYCLGHQEAKLKSAGLSEQQLFELDTNWTKFTPGEQAAFAFARKLTFAPQNVTDRDIDALRPHFAPEQILEIAFLVGRYNSTNRWTDSLGIPQEDHREFKSELPLEAQETRSEVAVQGFPPRTTITDFHAWQKQYEKAATRKSRLPLVATDKASLNYERLLANFPVSGRQWIEQVRQARTAGSLPSDLKNKIAYVAARADGAWYMQHQSRTALLKQGMNDSDIFALAIAAADQHAPAQPADGTAMALRFAHKLTTSPQAMVDSDIEVLLKHFSPQQVAEIVYHVGIAAFMDRVTESAGLGWSDEA